jgi:probable phosphoglycerate mutase
MTKFLLIRHALTDAVGKRLSGRTPGILLNDEGRRQSRELASRLSQLSIEAIYSSPLERALQTAAPLAEVTDLHVRPDNDFLEIDFGSWTNLDFEELERDVTFQRFNSFRSSTRIPGGELMVEAQMRMIRGIEKLTEVYHNQTVAIISHADLIKSAIAFYAGIHLDMFHRLEISPTSVSIIEIFDDTARILLVNGTGGLWI